MGNDANRRNRRAGRSQSTQLAAIAAPIDVEKRPDHLASRLLHVRR
jgi:hypothetical protein